MGHGSRVGQVVGLDVSDKWTQVYVLSMRTGTRVEEVRVRTTQEALEAWFAGRSRSRVALEVGPHSAWMSRLLEGLGHEVLVALTTRNERPPRRPIDT